MKRLMFLALCAVMAATAGVVTVTWTKALEGTVSVDNNYQWSIGTNDASIDYNGNADFAVRVTYSGTFKASLTAWSSLLSINGRGDITEIQNAGSGAAWMTGNATSTGKFFEGGQVADVTFTLVYDHDRKTVTAMASDGTTTEIFGSRSVTIDAWVTLSAGVNSNRLLDRLFDDGGATYVVEYTKDIEGVLPEPTALALLALGVAGFALRRKIA